MHDIFISYSSQTRDEAKILADKLTAMKYSVWWDSNLIPEGTYSDVIKDQLDRAKAIIVVWSPSAAKSLWVRSEANHAAEQDKLINTHAAGFNVSDIPRPLEQVHCVPVSDTVSIVRALQAKKVPRGLTQVDPVTHAALHSDELLPFLKICTTDELDQLVKFTADAWNADKIFEQNLTKHPRYPDHAEYVDEIDRQFRLLGGHAVMNRVRGGQGPAYKEILQDLCKNAKLSSVNEGGAGEPTIIELETRLLSRAFDEAFSKLSPEQKEERASVINAELARRGSEFKFDPRMKGPAAAILAQAGVNMSGFFIYKASAILINAFSKVALSRGLSLAANAGAMRLIGVAAGPVGWIATGLYTAHDAAKPAYRDLELGVLHIAGVRATKLYGDVQPSA